MELSEADWQYARHYDDNSTRELTTFTHAGCTVSIVKIQLCNTWHHSVKTGFYLEVVVNSKTLSDLEMEFLHLITRNGT